MAFHFRSVHQAWSETLLFIQLLLLRWVRAGLGSMGQTAARWYEVWRNVAVNPWCKEAWRRRLWAGDKGAGDEPFLRREMPHQGGLKQRQLGGECSRLCVQRPLGCWEWERESTLPSEEVGEIDRTHGVELGFAGPGALGTLFAKLNIKWPYKHTYRNLPGPECGEP